MDTEKDYSQYYNKGNDCDVCAYQYFVGLMVMLQVAADMMKDLNVNLTR